MRIPLTQGEKNLALLQKLIPSDERLYFWCYSVSGKLYATTCPHRDIFERAFSLLGGLEKAIKQAESMGSSMPIVLGSSIGLQWAAAVEYERKEPVLFVMGPVSYQPLLEHVILKELRRNHSADISWAESFAKLLPDVPVVAYHVFIRYALMLHNVVTGQQLGQDALDCVPPDTVAPSLAGTRNRNRNRNKIYLAERALLQMVRDGNISYHGALRNSTQLSPGVPVNGADPLRQAKTSIVVFTTLVSRAAIEGGLSPETAYSLGDSYIQAVEDCRDSGELSAMAAAMYHDFIYRVHHLHTNPNYSHAIQKCCDYVELNLDKKITAGDLASLVGYTEYYLTEKFKKETGLSVANYVKLAKIEQAKVLLSSTELSVQEVSERLAFNTPNYFIRCFREAAGYTPVQYRNRFGGG